MARGAGSISMLDQGLGSGNDFQAMIDKLYKVESRQAVQLTRWRQDWMTRLDAFKQIRTELGNLRTILGKMNSVDKFLVKNAVSSNTAVATASTGAEAAEGTYRLKVNQMASNSTWSKDTGLATKDAVVNSSAGMGKITYTYKGKQYSVNIPPNTSLDMMKNLINNDSTNPGVRASLIQSGSSVVFQLRGMDMGQNAQLSIDSTENLNGLDVSLVSRWVQDSAKTNSTSLVTGLTSLTDAINASGSDQSFVFAVNGIKHTLNIPSGSDANFLVDAVNTSGTGVTATADVVDGKVVLKIKSTTTTDNVQVSSDTTLTGYESSDWKQPVTAVEHRSYFTSVDDMVNPTGTSKKFIFNVGGKETAIDVPAGATLKDLALQINAGTATSGAAASLWMENGKVVFRLDSTDATAALAIGAGTLPEFSVNPISTNWTVQQAKNAEVRLNGFPEGSWIEVPTNTISDMVEGITFNLHSEGETVVSVNIDNDAITKNVQEFVDAMNSFRNLVNTLTKVDDNKKLVDLKYAESEFEMQKGSVLTGNYGIQLVASRLKQAVADSAPGFNYAHMNGDVLVSGDVFNALGQIGILTNSEVGNPMYGLLEINTIPDFKGSMSFEDALAKDPYAVATLFAAKEQGTADSEYFGYASHVHTITKGGTYDVKYQVDAGGNVTGTINGKQAKITTENGKIQMGLSSADQPSNPADGLFIDIYDLTPGAERSGTVSIRSGKVNQLISMLDGAEGMLGDKGSIKNMENNYEAIIKNIEDKIKREDDRLTRWENNMILKFSRLEATLGSYKSLQAQLESQIKQLSSSK